MKTPVLVFLTLFASAAAFATDSPAAPASSPAPAAASGDQRNSLKACNRKADAQNLTGRARSVFVRNCRAGKAAG